MIHKIVTFSLISLVICPAQDKKRKLEPKATTVTKSVLEQVTHITAVQEIIAGYVGHKFMLDTVIDACKYSVSCASYSPNGQYLACIGTDIQRNNTCKIWDTETMKLVGEYNYLHDLITLAWSPDSEQIALGSSKGLCTLRIAQNNIVPAQVNRAIPLAILSMAYSPHSRHLASTSHEDLHVWDAQTLKLLARISRKTDAPRGVCYSPDGNYLAACAHKESLTLFDSKAYQPLKQIETKLVLWQQIDTLHFSNDGKQLIGIGSHGTTFNFDISSGERTVHSKPELELVVDCATYSSDKKYFFTVDSQEITVWDEPRHYIIDIIAPTQNRCKHITCSPDGTRFAASLADGKIEIWQMPTQLEYEDAVAQNRPVIKRCKAPVSCKTCVIL